MLKNVASDNRKIKCLGNADFEGRDDYDTIKKGTFALCLKKINNNCRTPYQGVMYVHKIMANVLQFQ